MLLNVLVLCLFGDVLLIKRLELVRAECLDFLFDHLDYAAEALQVKLTGPIALATRQALVVHLGAFAFEARDVLLDALLVAVRARDQDVALHFLGRLLADLHLITPIDCFLKRLPVAASVAGRYFDLRTRNCKLSARGNIDVGHFNVPGHDADIVSRNQVFHVRKGIIHGRLIAADSHLVGDLLRFELNLFEGRYFFPPDGGHLAHEAHARLADLRSVQGLV